MCSDGLESTFLIFINDLNGAKQGQDFNPATAYATNEKIGAELPRKRYFLWQLEWVHSWVFPGSILTLQIYAAPRGPKG